MKDLALIKLDSACRALAEAKTIPEAKQIRDKAAAVARYLRQQKGGRDAALDADELAVRAERRLGELLDEDGERRGSRLNLPRGSLKSLPEGVTWKQSHRWKKVASVSKDAFEAELAKARERRQGITTTAVMRLAKAASQNGQRSANAELVRSAEPLADVDGVFQTLVIDPPWDWDDEGDVSQFGRGRHEYKAMPFDEIKALPVGEKADKNAHLYLWITNRSMPKGFALLDEWGFRFVTILTWCKPSIGMGNYFRGSSEHVLFGVRGSLGLLRKDVGTWFQADRPRRHSAKPDEFFSLVESCSPGPWIELFARKKRNGWASWGAEA